MNTRKKLLAGGLGIIGIGTIMTTCSEYSDSPGFGDGPDAGRTKNSLAAVVTGLVGQKLYGSSTVDVEIIKSFYPDARVTGYTESDSINTNVELLFTSSKFVAKNNTLGVLEGEVHKSEFNWKIKQISAGSYDVARFGPKFDATLEIDARDGIITGKYVRSGMHFDWDINGTYSENGDISMIIDGPFSLGIGLEGRITKR